MKKFYLTTLLIILAGYSIIFAQNDTFKYTGAAQTYTVPACVYQIKVDVRGAQGNGNTNNIFAGGLGGRVQGLLSVTPGDVLEIFVGSGGINNKVAGDWNGGGDGGLGQCGLASAGGGGGASDIRTTPYALGDRVAVGGGGGGTSGDRITGCGPGAGGGGGGGYYGGGGGGGYSGHPGTGGTQLTGGTGGAAGNSCPGPLSAGANGSFGIGGAGGIAPSNNQFGPHPGCPGGAGGGLTGATGNICGGLDCTGFGDWMGGAGGGGSNYAEPCMASVTQTQGFESGNGMVIIDTICGGSPLTVTLTAVNPTCGNGCNGSITASVTGGSSPYTYYWAPGGQTTQAATGLCGGMTYTLTLKDATGCITIIDSVTLLANNLNITANITSNEKCNGNCIGSITTTINGGLSPYTYSWTPVGGSNAGANNLCAGTYTISVQDVNGCTGTAKVTITQPAIITATNTVNNVLCNGGKGSATVIPSGGTSPYTYNWAPSGGTTATGTGLSAGTYTVTITDINGCTATTPVTLTQPVTLIVNLGSYIYPACNGLFTGSITATAAGGTPGYNYVWAPGGQTTANATGLSANTYKVTVTDANGCTVTASGVISQPATVTANIVVQSYPLCNGGTGTATASGSGGTPGYSYVWNPTAQTTATATGLIATIYTVTIKDSHGCTGTASVTISQPSTLAVTASFTHASCGLGNGTATAAPTGGTVPYVYLWAPSAQTNITAVGLHAGSYTVTVTDKNHCTASASVTVTQPTAVVATITGTTNISCNAGTNGTATAVGSGGTGPYGYLWSPGGNSNAVGTGLHAGSYTMTVTDANGCTATASTILTQPPVLGVIIVGPGIRCLGNGANYTANATGGTVPYGYSWSTGATTSGTRITPPGSQSYTVTVTDAHGCTANAVVTFSFPPPLAVTINAPSITCSGRSASLCALATGGTGGDAFTWEPVNLTSPCITVPPSVTTIYTITVVDNCAVKATATTTIHVNPPPAVVFASNIYEGCAPLCVQFRNMTASSGGKEQYNWIFGNGDTVHAENPIYCYQKSGDYNVTLTVVSDSGCSSTLNKVDLIKVYAHPIAGFTLSPQPATILNPTIQFMDKSTDQGGIIYRMWTFGDESDSSSEKANPEHTYHDTGSYCANLMVMDGHGCVDSTTNCLVIEPQYNLYIPSAFTPNGDGIDDIFIPVGQYIRSFEMYIFDRWGLELYHTTNINNGWNGAVRGIGPISQEDTYIYKITVMDAQYNQHSYIGNVTLLK